MVATVVGVSVMVTHGLSFFILCFVYKLTQGNLEITTKIPS